MAERHLHIIALENPWPLVHGGRFDLYYKLVAFSGLGIHISLHCFGEKNDGHEELLNYCVSIYYYPRLRGLQSVSATTPYIVRSRRSNALVNNLLLDENPILMEGIHTTWIANHPAFVRRKLILRLHNVEFLYYGNLALSTSEWYKKLYYRLESKLLRRYEAAIVRRLSVIVAVSDSDRKCYQDLFQGKQVATIPVLLDFPPVEPLPLNKQALYHGNLSVPENEAVVRFLLKEVFTGMHQRIVIAGRNPSKALAAFVRSFDFATLVPNPSAADMELLIRTSAVNLLTSFNSTGVKVKLIHALFSGRHCITNGSGVKGTQLEPWCTMADNAQQIRDAVQHCLLTPVSTEILEQRSIVLRAMFDLNKNAEMFSRLIW